MRPAGNVFPFFTAYSPLSQTKKTNFILYDQRPHGDDAFIICITVPTTKEKLMSVVVVYKAVLWVYVGFILSDASLFYRFLFVFSPDEAS